MRLTTSGITVTAMSCMLAVALSSIAIAAERDKISLGGGNSLSIYIAQQKGLYAEQNIDVTIPRTASSDELRDALVAGRIQLAAFGVDNALAMAEKKIGDVAVIMGVENPPIQLVGNKGMKSVQELRGKALLVDSPVTQNAVIMKRILAKYGLEADRDYSMKVSGGQPLRLAELRKDPTVGGTMVSWPEYFQIRAESYPVFGSSLDVLGPMTFQVIYVMRNWAASNRELVQRFLMAQVKAQRWMMDPNNRQEVIALYGKSRNYSPEVAAAAYEGLMSPTGWAKDGAIALPELASVMKLRAEVEGAWNGKPPPAETYVDTSYLNEAIRMLDRK
jgi:ABC-type nitrate/sulfonate/bicarbonate transport system substrate-binding protein